MAFEVYSTGSNDNAQDRPKVDWAGMNADIVETAGLQEVETIVGKIAGIYDVGIQPQPDAQYEWTGTPEEEAEETAKDPNVYFEDRKDYQDGGKVKRYKMKPVKAAQSVVFAIDLPQVIVDKGKWFGNSDPKPLRLLLGGEFTPAAGKTIAAKPQALTMRKNDKTNNQWSMPFNSTVYKMAVAAKLIKQGDPFLPNRLDELLGKTMQFKVQVYLKDGKYYTEKCAFAASLSRGQAEPEYDESLLHMIQFNVENKEEDLKQLRNSVKNTMRNAENFAESKIKDQIGEGVAKSESTQEVVTEVSVEDTSAQKAKPSTPAGFDSFDSGDIPF